mgnify:CR=1 FL=1
MAINRRVVNGILLLDKPLSVSSNQALQRAKRLFHAQKAGHTGSLDPLATGLLPLCFGEATKMSSFLLDSDKRYDVTVRLGADTATGDAEGPILQERSTAHLTAEAIEHAMAPFRDEIEQVPPMYSAIKINGQPLYKLARRGETLERTPRRVQIYELNLRDWVDPYLRFSVHCSKGTYIRTLAQDLGEALGCGAHVAALRRTSVGQFRLDDARTFEQLEQARRTDDLHGLDRCLLPAESALNHWPELDVTAELAFYLIRGQPVQIPRAPREGWVRLYRCQNQFLGVGQILEDGRVAPRRLVRQSM